MNWESLIDNSIIDVHEVQSKALVRALEKSLDPGESEAIALAAEINAELVLLDEAIEKGFRINELLYHSIIEKLNE